jgi:sialate O-acetylesterase
MKRLLFLLPAVFFAIISVHADIRLPAILGDHAMLQADKPAAVWGWAEPGAQVKVTFTGSSVSPAPEFDATADATGRWSGKLPALKSGTAGQIQVTSDKGSQKTVNDVLVGEVWLGSGQSNMAYQVDGGLGADPTNPAEVAEIAQNVANAKAEADAAQPPIRFFSVEQVHAQQPQDDVKGEWILVSSSTVSNLSSVAWNFAVILQGKLHMPVGMIVSSVGGTPVEAWMSKQALDATSVGAAVEERNRKALAASTPEAIAKYNTDMKAWMAANPTPADQFRHRPQRPKAPYLPTDHYVPNLLYNGMIHGLQPYTVRGVLWFQGDGNSAHPEEYSEMFQAMIKQWRADWNDQFPFYFMEINGMHPKQKQPVEPNVLSIVREVQHGGLQQPGVAMVVTIDLGTENPHFPNKKTVGERLVALAMRDCYGGDKTAQVDSPLYQSFTVEGGKIRLKFSHAEGLRVKDGGDLKGFAIRGADGKWAWATGTIDGQDIVVSSPDVPAPVAVRYGWASNPVVSVENGAGLPLAPFRTDTDSKE